MSFDLQINNRDLVISTNGDLSKVENTEKLIQDVLKIAITPIGGNRFFPWYGSPLSKSVIGMVLDPTMISNIAANQLRGSLETLQKMQKTQAGFQPVTAQEQIAAIQSIKVDRNIVDPRFLTVAIRILTRALTTANTAFNITNF